MAEALGAFYAVETAVEATAAGALAVSGATVPLHAKFQKINAPADVPASSGSRTKIIKNKLYAFGGDIDKSEHGHGIHILSFPSDFGTSKTDGQPIEVDFEILRPDSTSEGRPLERHKEQRNVKVTTIGVEHQGPWGRIAHATAAIGDYIYIIGGFMPRNTRRRSSSQELIPFDTIARYDTLTRTYTVIGADPGKCTEGLPENRYGASCTSSPYPPPLPAIEGKGPSLADHGTIFLHGGYDLSARPLHDTWSFDLGTRAWHKLPTVVEEALEDKSATGQISYVEHRLWYVNRSAVMYLELSELDSVENLPQDASISTGRVGTGQWQVAFPSPEKDPAALIPEGGRSKEGEPQIPLTVPTEATNHVLPVTTGAGRTYIVAIGSTNPQSMHLFQIPSASMTAASLKDTIRDKAAALMTAIPESGKFRWSKIEVIQTNLQEGEIERPGEELEDFAVASWKEYGDKFVIWGGNFGHKKNVKDGWVVSLD